MITWEVLLENKHAEGTCLHEDIKPTSMPDGHEIPNGSILVELDSEDWYLWDREHKIWIPQNVDRMLTSITVTAMPTKTAYIAGETFDPTGMSVKATYSDGTEQTVTGVTVPTAPLEVGMSAVTISYTAGGIIRRAAIPISVVPVAVVSIAVTTEPDQTEYIAGELLDLEGIVVTGTNNNGTTVDVTEECSFEPEDLTELTTDVSEVLISYSDSITTTQSITVSEEENGGDNDE